MKIRNQEINAHAIWMDEPNATVANCIRHGLSSETTNPALGVKVVN